MACAAIEHIEIETKETTFVIEAVFNDRRLVKKGWKLPRIPALSLPASASISDPTKEGKQYLRRFVLSNVCDRHLLPIKYF
jgi:hypothetical protein